MLLRGNFASKSETINNLFYGALLESRLREHSGEVSLCQNIIHPPFLFLAIPIEIKIILTSSHDDSVVCSHYFYFYVSRRNDTATEDSILSVLKFPTHPRPWHPQHNYQSKYLDLPSQNEQSSSSTERIINGYDFLGVTERMEESLVVLAMLAQIPLTDVVVFSSKQSGCYGFAKGNEDCVKLEKKWTTPKIDEYILGDYHKANKDDYLLYNAAQRSLDKTIDALGRKRVEENVELLKSLQQQNDEQCASKTTMPCTQPEDESLKKEHKRLAKESCYKSDFGCGHACTDEVLADNGEKEWASITSSYGQG